MTSQLANLKETLRSLGAFGNADARKEMEIKDLKDQIDVKNNQIHNLKQEVVRKVKKITEVEYMCDNALKEKDKEIATLQADLKANQNLFKEQQAKSRSKENKITLLNSRIVELESKLKEKTDADLTMQDVINRVKNELSIQYTPVISQLKEELSAKDLFYQRQQELLNLDHFR